MKPRILDLSTRQMQYSDTVCSKIELLPLQRKWLECVTDIHLEMYQDQPNFSLTLGRPFVKKTYAWFCENSNGFGFVAFVDGNPAGFIVGSKPDHRKRLNRYRFVTALRQIAQRPWILLNARVGSMLLCGAMKSFNKVRTYQTDFETNEAFNLYSLAVRSKYSRNRVSNLLLVASENYAAKMGRRVLFGYVRSQNPSSLILHHAMGYSVDKTRSNKDRICFYKTVATK